MRLYRMKRHIPRAILVLLGLTIATGAALVVLDILLSVYRIATG